MSPRHSTTQRRGSTILMVMIFSIALTIGLGVAANYAVTERSLNMRNHVYVHSRYISEAVLEHAFAQLHDRFLTRASLGLTALVDNPLTTPPADFLAPSTPGTTTIPSSITNVDGVVVPFRTVRAFPFVAQDVWVMGGVVPPGTWQTIAADRVNEGDPLRGQRVFVRDVRVLARAGVRDQQGQRPVHAWATQMLSVRDAPLFGNAIFYNLDMEIAPGPNMTITGPVHSNRNMFVSGGGGTLTFNGGMTSADEMFYGRMPGWSGRGQSNGMNTIAIMSTSGSYANWPSNVNLSSNYPTISSNWRTATTSAWGGAVQSSSHGMLPLNLVGMRTYEPASGSTPAVNDSLAIIQPPAALPSTSDADYGRLREIEDIKFSNRVGLRIVHDFTVVGGVANHTVRGFKPRTVSGVVQRTANGDVLWDEVHLPPDLVEVPTEGGTGGDFTMQDRRRNLEIRTLDLDVSVLRDAVEGLSSDPDRQFPPADAHAAAFNPATDWNGGVYIESVQTVATGVRLINGQRVPNRGSNPGVLIASNNAVYVKGHFNADGDSNTGSSTQPDYRYPSVTARQEHPAAIAGDAITLLSPGFNEGNSFSTTNPNSSTSFLEVSAAFLTGIVPSTSSRYSGGVENFPRFLENWGNSRTVRYRGSMVCLFESGIAREPWGGGYYAAPNRDWGFNQLFAEGEQPPLTPFARQFRRFVYRDMNRAEFTAQYDAMRAELLAAGASAGSIPTP